MARRDEDAEAFVQYLERRAPRALTIAQIANELGVERFDRKRLKAAFEDKVAAGVLGRSGKTRYYWGPQTGSRPPRKDSGGKKRRGPAVKGGSSPGRVEGRYSRVRAGYGFVEVLGKAAARFHRDILIPSGLEGAALHGDRVEVDIDRVDPRDHRATGRVASVVESAHERIIGTLESHVRGWRLVPNDDRLPVLDIVGGETPTARDAGLVAVVRMTSRATPTRPPRGDLERVVGDGDDPEVQFLTIAFEYGLRLDFPEEVEAEAEGLPTDPSEGDFEGREDLRELPFVTIDGKDARDFDDAVCIEEAVDGCTVWVAIADVSHYVRPGTALDDEAARRGTSAYFPDRAVPMLPTRLSNNLCSLVPERDRLVLVAEMRYDRGARRTASRFFRGVIRSKARLTYAQVAAALSDSVEDPPGVAPIEDAGLRTALHAMRDLMKRLYDNRVADGSLDLDLPEPIVELSEEGRCVGLRLLERNDAHRIIEELMLEANCAVATFLREADVAFPYRIHEPPDPASIDELNEFLVRFGLKMTVEDPVLPQHVQEILTRLRGHRLERVLSRRMLRSLTRAQYSATNSGHFGLAFSIYCHFTSPIRRYPDLLVHRQLGRVFAGESASDLAEFEEMEAAAVASSQAERNAMDAERAMMDLKRAEFMLGHLGEAETGTVTSVASFGFFVELDAYPVEGMVRVQDIEDDYYELMESGGAFQGVNTHRIIAVGDRVVVEARNVSLQRRQIDFELIEHVEDESTAGSRSRGRAGARRSSLPRRGRGRRR